MKYSFDDTRVRSVHIVMSVIWFFSACLVYFYGHDLIAILVLMPIGLFALGFAFTSGTKTIGNMKQQLVELESKSTTDQDMRISTFFKYGSYALAVLCAPMFLGAIATHHQPGIIIFGLGVPILVYMGRNASKWFDEPPQQNTPH